MFKKLREPWKQGRAKSIFAGIIFAVICLSFVFVGITPDQMSGGGAGSAATVNDTVISLADFQERVAMVENQYGNMSKDLPAAQRQMRAKQMRESALNELVSYELVFQSARKIGVMPTVAATRDLIVNIPAFQEGGRFARERYDQYLTYKGIGPADFEDKVKRDVVVGQVRELFLTAMRPPTVVKDLTSLLQETKLNVEFVKIDEAALQSAASDAKTLADFRDNADNKAKIQSYYDANKDKYTSKSEVRARHILIKGDGEEALKKIQDIRKEAEKGDFAELAKKYSEDSGTKDKGGDLDYFAKGKMVPAFEDAAFALPIGKLSDPVKTSFGYHLIKVEDRRGGETQPLEKVSGEIAKVLIAEHLKEEGLKEIATLLKDKKDISGWLAKYKLKWEESGEFSADQASVPKIEAGEEAVSTALKMAKVGEVHSDLLRAGPVSYVLRLKKKSLANALAKKSDDANDAMMNFMYSSEGAETLGLWAEELKKSALIRRNEALLN